MSSQIRYVVLDFDGTCTQIDLMYQGFLAAYLVELQHANPDGKPTNAAWRDALDRVRAASPKAGWSPTGGLPAAPAAADPYIHAGEAAALLKREDDKLVLPTTAFSNAYKDHKADWRTEVVDVLEALVGRDLHVGFISNSKTEGINARLDGLLAGKPALRKAIQVRGNAMKFEIQPVPPTSGLAANHLAEWNRVPEIDPDGASALGRPIYLRRGSYFEAICNLWSDFGEHGFPIAETIFCGDIWELDLALPRALGAPVHLVRRAPPYQTYDYELARTAPAHQSDDLRGLLARL